MTAYPTVAKDILQSRFDVKPVQPVGEWCRQGYGQHVVDIVLKQRIGTIRYKEVAMRPETERPFELLVNKDIRGVIGGDYRPPSRRQAEYADAVIDDPTLSHLHRTRRKHPEPEMRWREYGQVFGFLEKREDALQRITDRLFMIKAVQSGVHDLIRHWGPAHRRCTRQAAKRTYSHSSGVIRCSPLTNTAAQR